VPKTAERGTANRPERMARPCAREPLSRVFCSPAAAENRRAEKRGLRYAHSAMKARLPFASALLLALALPLACAKREAPPAAESAIAAEESRAAPAVAGVAGAAPAARGAQASPVPRPARKLIRSYDLSLEVR